MDKISLRKAALERRAAVPEATRQAFAERLALQGVEIARKLIARTVAAYWPMRGEPETIWLLEALAYHGFVVALPAVEAPGLPLTFRQWTSRMPMVEGPIGTIEPSRRAAEVRPDLLFVPLAAFDRGGRRIGYGGGYYDASLRELRTMKPVVAVGVAFSTQEVEHIPADPHDENLDLALTERELIDFCAVNTNN